MFRYFDPGRSELAGDLGSDAGRILVCTLLAPDYDLHEELVHWMRHG